ncbi:metalloproteinase inhibitor 2 isoform X1 [Austrofundulus limnaeus]|uniref:Metalloproteinase inhibitor 2 n=1 Tax=Austrofundulus limnaeus TaxID=52670 RepID=A0A2I4CGU0_AUSLI|nr:PREDICTED: metalloproteinase inhibitor 2-like isoform X1 [Austrofundulus limnaeus]
MTQIMKSCFISLAILFLWRVEAGAEAAVICHCPLMMPPLQALCNSDVVIQAFVIGKKEVDSGAMKSIKYSVHAIQVFKGPVGGIDAVYSPLGCTAYLQTDWTQYIITGSLEADGTVHITSCNFIKLWDELSTAELNLLKNYQNRCR